MVVKTKEIFGEIHMKIYFCSIFVSQEGQVFEHCKFLALHIINPTTEKL